MLAREHRLTSAKDYSAVMRKGVRAGTSTVVVAVLLRSSQPEAGQPVSRTRWRCGFIVSKAVGNAVTRHRATRRLRHIVRELIDSGDISLPDTGRAEIVIRALAESAWADHQRLRSDVSSGLRRALVKAERGS